MLGEIARGIRGKDLEIEGLSFGVALVIVGIDPSRNGENATQPKFWTIKEKKNKSSTGKVAGQLSLPGETRKKIAGGPAGEPIGSNVGGALAEFTDNSFIIVNNLFLVSESFRIQGKLLVNKNPFDVVVLIYEGPFDRSIEPLDKEEVSANGWMTTEEIEKVDQRMVRGFVWDLVALEKSEGIISRVVSDYSHYPTKRVPVSRILPHDFFSIEKFYKQREMLQDAIPH